MAGYHFQIYQDTAQQWRWRLVAGNGEIVAQSESYTRRDDAADTVRALRNSINQNTPIELANPEETPV